MKYDELLEYLGEDIKDKQAWLSLIKAVDKIFKAGEDISEHSCGMGYFIETGPDTATCLNCGKDFLILDD